MSQKDEMVDYECVVTDDDEVELRHVVMGAVGVADAVGDEMVDMHHLVVAIFADVMLLVVDEDEVVDEVTSVITGTPRPWKSWAANRSTWSSATS